MGYVTPLALMESFEKYSIQENTGWQHRVLCLSSLLMFAFLKNSIPVEDLASNGESVRAKVFHIVTTLCTQVPATDLNYDLVRDWCNMVRSHFPPSPLNLLTCMIWQQKRVSQYWHFFPSLFYCVSSMKIVVLRYKLRSNASTTSWESRSRQSSTDAAGGTTRCSKDLNNTFAKRREKGRDGKKWEGEGESHLWRNMKEWYSAHCSPPSQSCIYFLGGVKEYFLLCLQSNKCIKYHR